MVFDARQLNINLKMYYIILQYIALLFNIKHLVISPELFLGRSYIVLNIGYKSILNP
jgi:hypothetical protein